MTKSTLTNASPVASYTNHPKTPYVPTITTGFVEPLSVSDQRAHMTKTTVSQVLTDVFGADFSRATQDQRLLLLEAVALVLRVGGVWAHKLSVVCFRAHDTSFPENCFFYGELTTNEGLRLLAILNVAITEGYSVEATNKRLS